MSRHRGAVAMAARLAAALFLSWGPIAVAQPSPGMPSWSANSSSPPAEDGPDGKANTEWVPPRHWLGVELGGTAALQVVWNPRVVGPVHLHLGAFAGPEYGNGSLGVRVHFVDKRSWGWSAGAGAGGMFAVGFSEPCAADSVGCEERAPSDSLGFGWALTAIDTEVGNEGRTRLGLEAGLWAGARQEVEPGGRERNGRFVTVMLGATLLFAL